MIENNDRNTSVHRNSNALEDLAARVEKMQGAGTVEPGNQRANEPVKHRTLLSGHEKVNAILADAAHGRAPRTLNLDCDWDEDSRVGSLATVAIAVNPKAAETARKSLDASGAKVTPQRVAQQVLRLGDEDADRLLRGPNYAGAARRWISPEDAAQACRLSAAGTDPSAIWPDVDREKMHAAALTEDFAEYRKEEINATIETWQDDLAARTLEQASDGNEPAEEPGRQQLQGIRIDATERVREAGRRNLIDAHAHIDPTATIGDEVEIERGAWIGPEAKVDHCTVGIGAVVDAFADVKHSTLEAGSYVGSEAAVRGAILETEASVGAHTVIATPEGLHVYTGARIGQECLFDSNEAGWVQAGARIEDGAHNPRPIADPTPPPNADEAIIHTTANIAEDADIGKMAWVGAETTIEQDATLERGTRVWPGAHVKADAFIQENAQIRCNAEVGERAAVGPNVIVAEAARVADNATLHQGRMQWRDGGYQSEMPAMHLREQVSGEREMGNAPSKLYQEARADAAATISPTAQLGPGVVVEAGAVIKDGARIEAGAHIGMGVEIGENARVGPLTRIDNDSVIQERARVEACVDIGKDVLICRDATIRNRADIGDGALAGSRAIVEPQTCMKPRTEIGTGQRLGTPTPSLRAPATDRHVRIGTEPREPAAAPAPASGNAGDIRTTSQERKGAR